MKKLLLIINPNSGKGLGRHYLPQIINFFQKPNFKLDVFETKTPKDATKKAKAARNRYDIIIAAGGDGTINEVVNGMVRGKASLAIVPIGTANVLASQFSIPNDVMQACELILSSAPKATDVGIANHHYFLQSCGIGFDAKVISDVDLRFKQKTGKFLFYMNILKNLCSYRAPKFRAKISKRSVEGYTLVVLNSKYYGGRFIMSEKAKMDDGLLDVVVFEKDSSFLVLRAILSGFIFGRLLNLNGISFYQGKSIRVQPLGARSYIQTDGELIGQIPANISIKHGVLKVIY